jgi:hypothetical protein
MRSVGANSHRLPVREPRALPTTDQCGGASTDSAKVALRSGWSKQAKMRWASSRKLMA